MLELVAAGRDADVFAWAPGRVLRRYRDGGDATREAGVMTYLADQGYPVPEVFEADGPDLVLARVDGPSLLDALIRGDVELGAGMRLLADLVNWLHGLPGYVLHMDLHPGNVLLGPDGPVVIDWRNARDGDADLDTAMSALLLAQLAVHPDYRLVPDLRTFLRHVTGNPREQLTLATELRRDDPNLTLAEREQLTEAKRFLLSGFEAVAHSGFGQ
ncbi:phosphotransferase [Actinocrispum sp. NPDC049592]|uniref:phosphotransferase n=1 Tax=Actinocrispum sp. NPDC049592 TaxID=3154835 RepID=UPI00343585B4